VQAEALTRRLLELDPSNREARMLHNAANETLRRSSIQERIQANVRAVDDLLAAQRFPEAISSLESALALYPDNALLSARLAEARESYEQHLLAERRTTMEPPVGNDRTVLVAPDTLDRTSPPSGGPPEDFTRFFGSAEVNEPLDAFLTVLSCSDPYREGPLRLAASRSDGPKAICAFRKTVRSPANTQSFAGMALASRYRTREPRTART
jgi:hypothetical protein